jgi:hypothetical protein
MSGGYEQIMPMSESVREALLAWRKECPGIGSTLALPFRRPLPPDRMPQPSGLAFHPRLLVGAPQP